MIGALFRLVLIAAGIGCGWLAWQFWMAGVPPLWSIAADRVETVVIWAELGEGTTAGGRTRQVPQVQVAWPPGSADAAEVVGLLSMHDVWHMRTPDEVIRDHPAGSKITVRSVGGRPMADRTDLRDLGYALTASLLALGLPAIALALTVARWRRGRGEETAP